MKLNGEEVEVKSGMVIAHGVPVRGKALVASDVPIGVLLQQRCALGGSQNTATWYPDQGTAREALKVLTKTKAVIQPVLNSNGDGAYIPYWEAWIEHATSVVAVSD